MNVWAIEGDAAMDGRNVSRLVAITFFKHTNLDLRITDYRHLVAYFGGTIKQSYYTKFPIDETSGHSSAMAARHYANCSNDHRFMDSQKMYTYKLSQPHFEASVRMRLAFPKVGTWSPPSSITENKTPCLEVFYILLKRPWSVDVENGLAWAIQTFATQVMVERRAGSQTGSLILDHKKSGIDPIPMCAGEVQHTVGKLLRRAIRLLQISSQSEVRAGSYELPKSRESKPG